MSRRTAQANNAVLQAWIREKELVEKGQGTRDWTETQQKDILERGRAYDENGRAFEGHHMKSVERFPEYQGNPDNIQFLNRSEHLNAHNGSWQYLTNGFYDPEKKVTIDFGDGFNPIKNILLSNPVFEIVDQESEYDKPVKKGLIKKEPEKNERMTYEEAKQIIKEHKGSIGERVKKGVKNFSEKHPELVELLIREGSKYLINTAIDKATSATSNKKTSKTSSIRKVKGTGENKKNNHKTNKKGANRNTISKTTIKTNNDTSVTKKRNKAKEHMVSGHKQRYHKNGKVEWIYKDTYKRCEKKSD